MEVENDYFATLGGKLRLTGGIDTQTLDIVPRIHLTIAIASPEAVIHTREFASAAASEAGHEGLMGAAKAMAMTVADILQPEMLDTIKQESYSYD